VVTKALAKALDEMVADTQINTQNKIKYYTITIY
jgi:hypothetical protein